MTEEEAKRKHSQLRGTDNLKSTAKYRHKKQEYIDSIKTPCDKAFKHYI